MSAVKSTSSSVICPHGYFEWRCGICSHLEGECDFGSCHATAEHVIEELRDGSVVERRPMCAHHVDMTRRHFCYSTRLAS